MCLTPNMYKIVTLNANAKKSHHFKMHLTSNMYKIVTLKAKMLRKSLLENACDTKYVQNRYFAGKCSGNCHFKMHLTPNMYENCYFEGKCPENH